MAMRERIYGATHLQTAEARVGRGRALAALGRVAEAREAVETALAHLAAGGHTDSVTAKDAAAALAEIGAGDPTPIARDRDRGRGADASARVRAARSGRDGRPPTAGSSADRLNPGDRLTAGGRRAAPTGRDRA